MTQESLDIFYNRSEIIQKENLGDVRIDRLDSQGKGEEVCERSRRFRKEVEILVGSRSSNKDREKRRDDFLRSVAVKCRRFNDCYQPFEVIAESYYIGQRKILQGEVIPNTEAWMRLTIWNLIRNRSRTNSRSKKRLSLESDLISLNNESLLSIAERISAPVDLENPYYVSELEDERRIKSQKLERLRIAIQSLTERERYILELREIKSLSWEKIAQEIEFKGQLSTLRKQGSRALEKLRNLMKDCQIVR